MLKVAFMTNCAGKGSGYLHCKTNGLKVLEYSRQIKTTHIAADGKSGFFGKDIPFQCLLRNIRV